MGYNSTYALPAVKFPFFGIDSFLFGTSSVNERISEKERTRATVTRNTADLSPEDQNIIADFMMVSQRGAAYSNHPARKIFEARIRDLRRIANSGTMPDKVRIDAIIRLYNFDPFIKMTGTLMDVATPSGPVLKGSIAPISSATMCQNVPLIIRPEQIPDEVKMILAGTDIRKGFNYYQHLIGNVDYVVFARDFSSISMQIEKRFSACYELVSRTALVESLTERKGIYSPWEIAVALVHESAHIEWGYRYAKDPDHLQERPSERNAHLAEYRFLKALLKNNSAGKLVSAKDEEGIIEYIEEKLRVIHSLNIQMGLPKEDYSAR